MPLEYNVGASAANLRSSAGKTPTNLVATLPAGHAVTRIPGEDVGGWARVRTLRPGTSDAVAGFLSRELIVPSPVRAAEVDVVTNAVVDLSHHNAVVNFIEARADGIVGMIHKATQGTSFVDPKYLSRRPLAVGQGLLWGAYHFGTAGQPRAQAAHFLKTVKPDASTLIVLDLEVNPAGGTMGLADAEEFVRTIRSETGRWPGLYSGHHVKELLGGNTRTDLANCWFWLSQYGPAAVVPPAWSDWTLWQYTDGKEGPPPREVKGIGGCDRDRFRGSEAALRQFWGA